MNIPGKCDTFPWVYKSSAHGLVIVWECCAVIDKLSTTYNELRWQGSMLIPFFIAILVHKGHSYSKQQS